MRTTYLVCYDICDDKRLKKVFKTMRNYGAGTRLERQLTATDLVRCRTDLAAIIKHSEDQVLFVNSGSAEGRGDRVITAMAYLHRDRCAVHHRLTGGLKMGAPEFCLSSTRAVIARLPAGADGERVHLLPASLFLRVGGRRVPRERRYRGGQGAARACGRQVDEAANSEEEAASEEIHSRSASLCRASG